MALFAGKTPAERNKTIAAIVLGIIAVLVLAYSFGGSLLPGRGPQTPPVADSSPQSDVQSGDVQAADEQVDRGTINSDYIVTPVLYNGGRYNSPISSRNIFAFYEPPPFTPTPTPGPTFVPPTPTPEAPMLIRFMTPANTYAGSKDFRLEVAGEKFAQNARIVFNGNALSTTFISSERLSANVPASLVARAGAGSVFVNTPDGQLYSYPASFNIIPPPRPDFDYIGVIARQHYNNDTAYFQERGRQNDEPFTARLNDVVKGRFRVVSISSNEVEFVDVMLGFRHKLELLRPDESSTSAAPGPDPFDNRTIMQPRPVPRTGNVPTQDAINRAIEELRRRQQQQQQQDDDPVEVEIPEEPEPDPPVEEPPTYKQEVIRPD